MAVDTVTEIYPNRGGPTGPTDSDVRAFQVVTTVGTDNKYIILASGRVPRRGDPHNTQSNLICKKVICEPDSSVKSPRHWIVKAEYDNEPLGALPQNQQINPNPLLRPMVIKGRSLFMKRARKSGALIKTATQSEWDAGNTGFTMPTTLQYLQNTAGDPFEGLDENAPIWAIDVTVNDEAVQDWVRLYQGCVNNATVQVQGYSGEFRRWSLMVMEWGHSELLYETLPSQAVIPYYATNFSIYYNRKLWVTPLLNEGYYESDGEGRLKETRSRFGVRKKVLLDAAGRALANPSPSNALFQWYADGPEVNFSIFNLSL